MPRNSRQLGKMCNRTSLPIQRYRDPGKGRLICIIAQGTLEREKTENPILIAQNQSAEGRKTVSTH